MAEGLIRRATPEESGRTPFRQKGHNQPMLLQPLKPRQPPNFYPEVIVSTPCRGLFEPRFSVLTSSL